MTYRMPCYIPSLIKKRNYYITLPKLQKKVLNTSHWTLNSNEGEDLNSREIQSITVGVLEKS